jgi:hypothetical protein
MIEPLVEPLGTIRPLPVLPRPRPTDTLDSYIRRLAIANHLKPGHLRAYLCQPPEHHGRPRLDRTAAISGRPQSTLQQALSDLRCAECGRPQPIPADTGRPARWCSVRCRKAAHRKTHRPEPRPALDSICEHCGTIVSNSRPVRWCSRTCRRVAGQRTEPKPPIRSECEQCGAVVSRTHTVRWCSSACREAAWNRTAECGFCGTLLTPAAKGRPARWCSPRCRRAVYRVRRKDGALTPEGSG